jgi:hypothetical protein
MVPLHAEVIHLLDWSRSSSQVNMTRHPSLSMRLLRSFALFALMASVTSAEAQQVQTVTERAEAAPASKRGAVRLYWEARLAAFGKTRLSLSPEELPLRRLKADMRPGGGVKFGAGWVGRRLGISAEGRVDVVRMDWVDPYTDTTVGAIASIVAVPRLVHRVRSQKLELHASTAIGVAVPALRLPAYERTAAPGLLFEPTVGLTYFFAKHVGFTASTGLTLYRLRINTSDDSRPSMKWVQWNVLSTGIAFAP